MKYLKALTIILIFCYQPAVISTAQNSGRSLSPAELENKKLKEIIKNQIPPVEERKDSLSTLYKKIDNGELKPKVVYKYKRTPIYRTKIKLVHDTVYLPYPSDHNDQDYAEDDSPCPDTLIIRRQVIEPVKKKTFFERVFNHKKRNN